MMDRYEIDDLFEHKMLPYLFFEEKYRFLNSLVNDNPSRIYHMHQSLYKSQKVAYPYTEEDYSAKVYRYNDSIRLILIAPPFPAKPGLCCFMILVFHLDLSKQMFFTVEKNDDGSASLCSRNIDGEPQNYGAVKIDTKDMIDRCMEIFNA